MTRDLSAGTRAEVRAAAKRPAWFIEAEFRTVTLRMWTGMGTIQWNGQTWYGPGTAPIAAPGGITGSAIVEIQRVMETSKVEATGLKIVVSQFPPALLRYCVDELRVGKAFNVWLGFLNLDGTALVDDPVPWFGGWMDAADVEQDPAKARITLTIENEMRRLQIPILRRLTLEDQHADFPTDDMFKYVAALKNWKGTWGSRQIMGGTGSGGCCEAGTEIVPLAGAMNFRDAACEDWCELLLADGKKLLCTPDHPVYTDNGKVEVQDLGRDEVITRDGLVAVSSLRHVRKAGWKRIACTPNGHLYWANGILSHNKLADPEPGKATLLGWY
jgi:hypothetical protein